MEKANENTKKSLGDRMKRYEKQLTDLSLIPRLPIIARLDGKKFSSFTRGLKKPFDQRLSDLMIETTKYLLEKSNANFAYTASDEITLVWYSDDINSEMIFDGKFYKIVTYLSSIASVYFNHKLRELIPEKIEELPTFDCRVFNVPNLVEVINNLIFRERDTVRNSISMAAESVYSPKQLHKKSSGDKQDMLHEKGINWNNYPVHFKRGVYFRKVKTELTKSVEVKGVITETSYIRNIVTQLDIEPLSKMDMSVAINLLLN